MSNLQDVPQADPGGLPLAGSEGPNVPRPNALKRFFKVFTFSRLLTRKKAPNTDGQQQLSSAGNTTQQEEMHEMQLLQNERTTESEQPQRNPNQEPQLQIV